MNSKKSLEKLKEIVGEEMYANIISELAGSIVYFPNEVMWTDKDDRNESLRENYYSGHYDISDLARKYNLSISQIYKIIQKREK